MEVSGACFFLVLPCSFTLIFCLFLGFVLIQKDRRQAGCWVGRYLLGSGTPAFPRIPVGFLGEFRRVGGWGSSGSAPSDPHPTLAPTGCNPCPVRSFLTPLWFLQGPGRRPSAGARVRAATEPSAPLWDWPPWLLCSQPPCSC